MKKTVHFLLVAVLSTYLLISGVACTQSDISGVTGALKDTLTKLDTPDGVYLDDENVLHWNVVSNASSYLIVIDDTDYERTSAVCDLKQLLTKNGDYYVSVIAKSNRTLYEDSDASAPKKITFTGVEEEITTEEKPYGLFDELSTKESFLGYGFNVINSSVFSDKNVISSFCIFDTDELMNLRLLRVEAKYSNVEEITASSMESFLANWNIQANVDVKWGGKSIGGSVGVKAAYSGGVENAASKYFHCISITNQKFYIVLQSDMETYKNILSGGFETALYSDIDPAELFKNYGTHFITSAVMGGKINSHYLYSSVSETSYTELSAKVSTSVRYAVGKTNVNVQGDYKSEAENKGVYIKNSLEVLGGGDFGLMSDEDLGKKYAEWEESLNEHPSLIGIKDSSSLIPIWNLIDASKDTRKYSYDYDGDGIYEEGNRSQQLQAYFNAYGIESYNALMEEAGIAEIIVPDEISNARVNNVPSDNGEYEGFAGVKNELTFAVKPDQATGYTKSANIVGACDFAKITNEKGVLALEIDADAPANAIIEVVLSAGSVRKLIKVTVHKKYTVFFESNGGSKVEPYKDVLHNSQIDEPIEPKKEGYKFAGWYTDPDFKEDTLYKFGEQSVQSNLKLYARWQSIKPRISFVSNGGSEVDAMVIVYKTKITEPIAPTKYGYTFGGWYLDKTLEEKFDFDNEIIQDTVLYAKWVINVYTVIFETSGGSDVAPYKDVLHNSQIDEPIEPKQEGYKFAGWYTDPDFKEDTLYKFGKQSVQSNLKLYARWQAIKPRISFVSNGGSEVDTMVIVYKTKITEPIAPTKYGYTFGGWYLDKTLEEKFDFDNEIIQDTVLYAKWVINVYTVTFESNGGYLSVSSICAEHGSKIAAPVTTKNGYTFGGWFKDDEYGVLFDFSNDTVLNDMTLYAKWSTNLLSIVFDTYCDVKIDDRLIEYDTELGVNMPNPSRIGYEFVGWFKEDALENQVYKFTKFNETNFPSILTDNGVVLYAQWKASAYTIVYNANGGKGVMPNSEFVYDKTDNINANIFVREGYTFGGWSPDVSDTEIIYDDFDKSLVLYAEDGIITLYAIWVNCTYEITFDKNTPDGAIEPVETMDAFVCTYDVADKLPKNTFTVNGWIFKGWTTRANGMVVYSDEAYVMNLSSENNGMVTLYAAWDVDPYTIGKYVSNAIVVSDTDKTDLYTVYNDISETPRLSCKGKVIVDWSMCGEGVYDYVTAVNYGGSRYGGGSDDLEIVYGVSEVFFVGNIKSTYTSVRIVTIDYPVASSLMIHMKDMNITADYGIIDSRYSDTSQNAGMNLTIDCVGVNTIKAIGMAQNAIVNHNNIKFIGDGTMSITGGNGGFITTVTEDTTTDENSDDGETTTETVTTTLSYDGGSAVVVNKLVVEMSGSLNIFGGNGADSTTKNDGSNGGSAVVVNNLVIKMRGALTIIGGNGGNGSDASDSSLSLTNNGSNGGNGGIAIEVEDLTVEMSGTLTIIGGNGGNGGKGGSIKSNTVSNTVLFSGKDGGNGGNGGAPLSCGTIRYESIDVLNLVCGNGGNGGNGGDGKSGGNGGNGGDAGNLLDTYNTLKQIPIVFDLGKGGDGGNGGDGIGKSSSLITSSSNGGNGGDGGNGGIKGVGGTGGLGTSKNGVDGTDGEILRLS